MGLFDTTQLGLEQALSGAALRQRAIANNIANANTAGYKRSDVDFHSALAGALGAPDAQSKLRGLFFKPETDTSSATRADGNNVDIDREATYLAQTQLQFSALMAVVTKNLTTMSSIITGAR